MSSDRRRVLRAVLAGAAGGLAGCTLLSSDDPTPTETPEGGSTPGANSPESSPDATPTDEPVPDEVALETVIDGLDTPLAMADVPDRDLRYVATRPGRIVVHGPDGLRDEPLLDLQESVLTGGERGLLGIALHPEFAETRRLFVRYSSPPPPGTSDSYSHTFVLAEFAVNEDGTSAGPDSERTVLEIPEPQGNHNAGDLAFGPDGYLYVPTGDGGGAGDVGFGHVDDWYDRNAGGNGQDTTENLLGGLLRIDVDGRGDRAYGEYGIPADNTLTDRDGHLGEYYAWGLRNPWRVSFDGENCFVGDVGQDGWEEVDLVEKGGNYGWNVREGRHCFDPENVTDPPEECPTETPQDVRGGEPLIDPIVEYPTDRPAPDRMVGTAVVGGEVYRGSAVPGLVGRYVFGDLVPEGRLFVATPPEDGDEWSTAMVELAGGPDRIGRLLAFGRDEDGEVYVIGDDSVSRIAPAG
ncbi:sugar dehydrogenase [Halobacteriales archaeon QS_1_68_20]|nr:MAG: sugar dehydrogenase [Halobacteriales archaeon QS_1_68_20]